MQARSNHRLESAESRDSRGFTLLELLVAFAVLALFVLPLLEIMAAARIRAVHYTRDRQIQILAQRQLYDHAYSIEPSTMGNFELDEHPDWTWEILPPDPVNQGSQPLLQFTIVIRTPHSEARAAANPQTTLGDGFSFFSGAENAAYQLSLWTLPTEEILDQYWEELDFMGAFGGYSDLGPGVPGMPGMTGMPGMPGMPGVPRTRGGY